MKVYAQPTRNLNKWPCWSGGRQEAGVKDAAWQRVPQGVRPFKPSQALCSSCHGQFDIFQLKNLNPVFYIYTYLMPPSFFLAWTLRGWSSRTCGHIWTARYLDLIVVLRYTCVRESSVWTNFDHHRSGCSRACSWTSLMKYPVITLKVLPERYDWCFFFSRYYLRRAVVLLQRGDYHRCP